MTGVHSNDERPTPRPRPVCAVTGLPAKYRDPVTGKHYATLDAFRRIRADHERIMEARERDRVWEQEDALAAEGGAMED